MATDRILDGMGEPIEDTKDYYLQDTRQVVGNCALWWGVKSQGYTCQIKEAGTYQGAEARSIVGYGTARAWPVPYVMERVVEHVDVQGLYPRKSKIKELDKDATHDAAMAGRRRKT